MHAVCRQGMNDHWEQPGQLGAGPVGTLIGTHHHVNIATGTGLCDGKQQGSELCDILYLHVIESLAGGIDPGRAIERGRG